MNSMMIIYHCINERSFDKITMNIDSLFIGIKIEGS